MTDTLNGNCAPDKPSDERTLPTSTTVRKSRKMRRNMPVRDPKHPVKLRAQSRAVELGKSLGKVYVQAGVNKAYLSEIPKSGMWRRDKLEAIASELSWTVDELLHGQAAAARHEPRPRPTRKPPDDSVLMETAAETAFDLILSITPPDQRPSAQAFSQLFRKTYEFLRFHVESGAQLPSQSSLRTFGRFVMAELKLL